MRSTFLTDQIKPNFLSLFFFSKEIVDYLFEEKLPELEEKLEKKKGKPLSSDNSTAMQQKKTFRLSDIFYSSEDSD